MTPKIMIVALENKEYCPKIIKKYGRITDVYYYNSNEITYCCEVIPSYYLNYINSYTEKSYQDLNNEDEIQEYEEILEEIKMENSNIGIYVHCHELDKNKKVKLLDDFINYNKEDYIDNIDNFIKEVCRPDEFWCEDFLPF